MSRVNALKLAALETFENLGARRARGLWHMNEIGLGLVFVMYGLTQDRKVGSMSRVPIGPLSRLQTRFGFCRLICHLFWI
jgi:hypothetical protein